MKLHLIALAIFTLTFNSCGTSKRDLMKDPLQKNTITGSYWKLEELEGIPVDHAGNTNKEIGFRLDAENKRISGYSGCNNFMGEYTLESGDRIHFSSLGSTKMACSDLPFNELEFLEIFEIADNYRISGDRLELNVGKRAPLAVFKRNVTSSEPIVEKYWKLKVLRGKEVKMDKNQEREVFFRLQANDKRVTGFAGCNSITGSYTLEKGDRIRFSQMATTMMACPDVSFNESEFLKIFEIADNYRINGDKLEIYAGSEPLAEFEEMLFN